MVVIPIFSVFCFGTLCRCRVRPQCNATRCFISVLLASILIIFSWQMSARRGAIAAWFMATSLCKSYAHVRIVQIEDYFKCQKHEMLSFISEWFYFYSCCRSINIFSWELSREGDVLAGLNTYRQKRNASIYLVRFEYIVELKYFTKGTLFT